MQQFIAKFKKDIQGVMSGSPERATGDGPYSVAAGCRRGCMGRNERGRAGRLCRLAGSLDPYLNAMAANDRGRLLSRKTSNTPGTRELPSGKESQDLAHEALALIRRKDGLRVSRAFENHQLFGAGCFFKLVADLR